MNRQVTLNLPYPCYTLMSNNKDNAGQLLETEGKYGKTAASATMAIWVLDNQVKRRTRSTATERKLRNLMTAFKLKWTGRFNPWTLEYRLPALQSADKFRKQGKFATLYFCHV